MSDERTYIRTPRDWRAGIDLAWVASRAEAIEHVRRSARHDLAKAQAVLDTPDEQFQVTIRRGGKIIRILWPETKLPPDGPQKTE